MVVVGVFSSCCLVQEVSIRLKTLMMTMISKDCQHKASAFMSLGVERSPGPSQTAAATQETLRLWMGKKGVGLLFTFVLTGSQPIIILTCAWPKRRIGCVLEY